MKNKKHKIEIILREFDNPISLEGLYERVIRGKRILNKQIIIFYNQQKDKLVYILFLELSSLV